MGFHTSIPQASLHRRSWALQARLLSLAEHCTLPITQLYWTAGERSFPSMICFNDNFVERGDGHDLFSDYQS